MLFSTMQRWGWHSEVTGFNLWSLKDAYIVYVSPLSIAYGKDPGTWQIKFRVSFISTCGHRKVCMNLIIIHYNIFIKSHLIYVYIASEVWEHHLKPKPEHQLVRPVGTEWYKAGGVSLGFGYQLPKTLFTFPKQRGWGPISFISPSSSASWSDNTEEQCVGGGRSPVQLHVSVTNVFEWQIHHTSQARASSVLP